jgi:Mg-chelatase subunit ChlI
MSLDRSNCVMLCKMKSLFENVSKCEETRSKCAHENGNGEANVSMRVASEACVIASQKRHTNKATKQQNNKATKQQSNKQQATKQQATKQQATSQKQHKKEEQSINGGDRTLDLKRVKLAS